MKNRGDAVGDCLPVAVGECDVDRKINAGSRHHLPPERIAVNIDDPRQDRQASRIDTKSIGPVRRPDAGDVTSADPDRRFGDFVAEQGAAIFEENIGHVCQRR